MSFFFLALLLIGVCFGSFVSAISWRIPRKISFVKGRSICPECKNQIKWYDNIPLLSYIFLYGKCRNCKRKISLRYPVIELSSGIGFVLIYQFVGIDSIIKLILSLAIFVILLTIFVIDIEHQIIPDSLIFIGIIIVLFYSLLTIDHSLFTNLFSGFLAASFLMLIHLITKGRGMGLGDVKFAVLGGMMIDLKFVPLWLLTSFLTGAVVGIILILIRRAKLKTKIAFGPFLIIGIGITLIFGDFLLTFLKFS